MIQTQQIVRAPMLEALEQQLIPMLQLHGFEKREAGSQERATSAVASAFPLGKFQRRDGPNLQLVEVQLDKHGAPKFVINFGIAPPGGVTLPWGHFEQSSLSVSSLDNAFRLFSNPRWQRWFGPGFFPFARGRRAATSVTEAAAAFHEVADWFEHGTIGAHMKHFGVRVAPLIAPTHDTT